MKVLHVSTAESWRGGEQQIAYLWEELAKRGVEQVITCRKGSEVHRYCRDNEISHYGLRKRSSVDPFFAKKLAHIAQQESADIVHVHDSHAHSFAVMAASFFGMKPPIVLHRRVAFTGTSSAISRFKYNHPQIEKIICISHEVKRVLDQNLKDKSKSVVVHSAIDISRFDPTGEHLLRKEFNIPPSKKLVGNIAALTFEKGYTTFVETARILLHKREDAHFFIIGSGAQQKEIEDLIERYGLQRHFTLPGFRSDVAAVLPCLDVLLFTSESEGLGTTILDAFAAKVAVVSTNAGGIPELIDHGRTGFMADVKDSEALAHLVEQVLDDDELRTQLVKNAFREVQKFDKSAMAQKVLDIYGEVLKNRIAQ